MTKRRLPQHLSYQGIQVDGPEITVVARLVVQTTSGKMQPTGPLLMCAFQASELLDDDVCNAVAWAQHQAEVTAAVVRSMKEAASQLALFPVAELTDN